MAIRPTSEQINIVNAAVDGGNGIASAFAGAAKTTSTVLIAKAKDKQRERGQILAYNRSIVDDARRKGEYPRSCNIATMHSIAFRAVGVNYKHRLDAGRRMRASEIADILGITQPFRVKTGSDGKPILLSPWALARLVMDTVRRFCYSAEDNVMPYHMPFVPNTEDCRQPLSELVAGYANRAWADLCKKDGRLKYEHDHYLKQYALGHPKLKVDYLGLDEAQDSNAVVSHLVMEQDAQKILVGDEFQAIYAWRGAEDAMSTFADQMDWHLHLTKSFRFGEAIAAEANKWLTLLGAAHPLVGFERVESELRSLPNAKTILCRTNATVIAEAIEIQQAGNTIAIVGGTKEIIAFARAVQDLQAGKPTSHPDLMAFKNWVEVCEYVEEEGSDLKVLVNMIQKYGVSTVMQVAETAVDEKYADTILSTAHKAKGREWESVRIANDFQEPEADPETGEKKVNKAEFQLAYVAITRAMKQLDRGGLAWVDGWLQQASETNSEPSSVSTPPRASETQSESGPTGLIANARRKRKARTNNK